MKKNLLLTLLSLIVSIASFGVIAGPRTGCVGNTVLLYETDSTATGGTWSSSNASIATVNPSTGHVTGVSAGTCIITYTFGSSVSTYTFMVTAGPAPITGIPSPFCPGATATLASTTSGGTWSSSSSYVASINSSSGIVGAPASAVYGGTTTISYTTSTGCAATATLTVSPTALADSIMGAWTLCIGSSSTFTISTTGGTWSSSNAGIATVNPSTGSVTGVAVGTANISYTVSGPCGGMSAVQPVNIIAAPSAGVISGSSTVNIGATTTLTETVSGGTWSSGSTGIATINPTTGVVTGVAAGTAVITYSVTGCSTTATATFTITVRSPTGVINLGLTSGDVNIYPNPVSGKLNIQWNALARETGVISVTDITGKLIQRNTLDITEGAGSATLNLSGYANGLYFISIKSASINYTGKVQVQQ